VEDCPSTGTLLFAQEFLCSATYQVDRGPAEGTLKVLYSLFLSLESIRKL